MLAAALTAALLGLYIHRFEVDRSGGAKVLLLALTKAVPAGQKIQDDMLTVREVPTAYVEERSVRASDRGRILGLRTSVSLDPEELLLWSDLAISAEERRHLSGLVTPGFRAVYVKAVREDQGSALIRPGDYVDVIATLPRPGADLMDAKVAVVLLQKVLVLANGDRTSGDDPAFENDGQKGPPRREQGLTLSLNVQEAQLVALATDRGSLSVGVRNPDDQRIFDRMPDLAPSDFATLPTRGGGPRRPTGPAAPVRLTESPVARVNGAGR
jgi:pilus assembly protein CpaB